MRRPQVGGAKARPLPEDQTIARDRVPWHRVSTPRMSLLAPDPTDTDPPVVLEEQPADNGPAVLRALLLGFGIDVAMSELRRRLGTDASGTSIDDLEEVAVQLGLPAEQAMLPVEHLITAPPDQAMVPAIAVVEDEFEGLLFLLIWRTDGDRVQVMHTAGGSFWLSRDELESWLYRHDYVVSKQAWAELGGSAAFFDCVRPRIRELGASADRVAVLIRRARRVPWRGPAALDAVLRWLRAQDQADCTTLEETFEMLLDPGYEPEAVVPGKYWFVTPDRSDPDAVVLHGALIVSVRRPIPRRRWRDWFSRG